MLVRGAGFTRGLLWEVLGLGVCCTGSLCQVIGVGW